MKPVNGANRRAWLVLVLLLLTTTAAAETRYISDYLIVTVRSGAGNQYKILETIPTGTPVEVLEETPTHVKVVTPKGTEGYIRKQYVSSEIPKARQIEQLQSRIAELEEQLQQQEQHYSAQLENAGAEQQRIAELSNELETTRAELKQVQTDYQALLQDSQNVVQLNAENEQLAEQNNLLNSELMVLREENRNFHRSNMIQWFLAGAGVFFGGWLIGKISRKKQRGFSRL